jgi:hypothetical protein
MITGQWGELVNPTTSGTFISKNYVYTVPAGYNVDNCDISAFVTRDNNKHTHTGIVIPAKNGSTVGLSEITPAALTLEVYPNPVTLESVIYFTTPNSGAIQFDLFDLTGQKLSSYTVEGTAGIPNSLQLLKIAGNNKPASGIYMVSATIGKLRQTCKISIE